MKKTDIDELLESHDDMSTDESSNHKKQPGFIKTDSEDKENNNERMNDSL